MDTNSIMMMVQDKLPKDPASTMVLRDKLDKMSEAKRDEFMRALPMLNLKSPTKVFWLESFVFGAFGVGRFMIGDKVLGALRLGIVLLSMIFSSLAGGDKNSLFIKFYALTTLIMWIWWIVDLFLTGKKLRRNNLNKILQALG